MGRKSLWSKVHEMAILDRESYLESWAATGNLEVISQIESEIARTKALKGIPLARAIAADREGVRLAFLAAQCWFESLANSQLGTEKTLALAMAKRVIEKRVQLFGRTRLEAELSNTVSVPMHRVGQLLQSGLAPKEFLATLDHQKFQGKHR